MDLAPELEDFLEMKPSARIEGRMARAAEFKQMRPRDGQPASQPTDAYLGYDEKNLYVVFVAFDSEPGKIRARMVPRESFISATGDGIDDSVSVSLDTFGDQRRGYVFQVNAYGIQYDAIATEGSGGFDSSFDALWYSRGKQTGRGFVVWIAIPFRSLRFPPAAEQRWGILLNRDIPRANEVTFHPYLQNIDLVPADYGTEVVRTNRLINDGRGFFVKVSYLFRY